MKKTTLLVFAVTASFAAAPSHAEVDAAMCAGFDEAAKLPKEQDAVSAAPENHRVLLENEDMRVLEVIVRPGEHETLHHHRWPSVMIVDELPKFVNYDKDGNEIKSSAQTQERPEMPVVMRIPPQVILHSIHNTGSKPFHAIRIEYKRACPGQ
ncbi:MAG: hypothetical protein H7X89_03685 [Rhizobiales bacterium]|nr:hypothetical protein [Hyphomicrobiales bacterium]